VGRDTEWYALGSDFITPEFSRSSLLGFVERQKPNGMIIEFYDMLGDKTEDFGLNINDNTPLLILALWHHYQMTGDRNFLEHVFPAAQRATEYIASQRNEQGLVWSTSEKTGSHGMIGWRNIIEDYRLSGATTEVNSECYGAFVYAARMARELGRDEAAAHYDALAIELKSAINTHLVNPDNGLYYLNVDVDGTPRTDVTSDLVFPVIFEVASEEMALRIVHRLGAKDFWTPAGIRTTPRDAPRYSPNLASGLFGGVWTAVCYWYAFCASRFLPDVIDEALTLGFVDYERDPRRSNTVPGQFSEWLHGETLVNEGMMLSPWFPPRFVWPAVEGASGVHVLDGALRVDPRMPADWQWCGARNVPYRGSSVTWFIVRGDEPQLFANYDLASSMRCTSLDRDRSSSVRVSGDDTVGLALESDGKVYLFVGSTAKRAIAPAVVFDDLEGQFSVRRLDSAIGSWQSRDVLSTEQLGSGHVFELQRGGFIVLELTPR